MEKTDSNTLLVQAVALEVLSVYNASLVRVRDCNWQAASGDFWVVTGAHGSGKSDFLATVAGLQRPGAGSLRLFGEEVAGLSESEMFAKRMRIGFVFKGGGRMFPDLSVAENIALPLRYHGRMTARELADAVGKLAELTGIEEMVSEKTRDVGGNWLSRVGLARALALQPEILFLDEPIAGLDARHRRWWLGFLAQLWECTPGDGSKNVTLVVAVSDPDFWLDVSRQFALISDGRLQILSREQLREAEASWVEVDRIQFGQERPSK